MVAASVTGLAARRLTSGYTAAMVLLGVGVSLLPLMVSNYILTFVLQALMACALAGSWNLISGFTGYVSFGHAAFFGLGAYAAGIAIAKAAVPAPVAIASAAIVAGCAGLCLGYPALRLRGPYFAVGMLGVAEALRVGITVAEPVTGGGRGLVMPPQDVLLPAYFSMLALVVLIVAITRAVATRPVGLRLLAIREDEVAAEVTGIQTTRLKLVAFATSATLAGVAGGIYAWHMSYIDPTTVFAGSLTVRAIAMTMLGGQGTVFGPVIGSVVLSVIGEVTWARFPFLHNAVSGALIVVIVLFIPRGVTGVLQDRGVLPRSRTL